MGDNIFEGEYIAPLNANEVFWASFQVPKVYEIDFTKVETFEDMKKVMSQIPLYISNNSDNFEVLKPFLKEVKQP